MHFRILILALAVAASAAYWGIGGALASSTTPGGPNHIHSIAILPGNPNVLYIGSHYRLYKSTDGGKTWKPLLAQMFLSLAIDASHPNTMYGVSLTGGFQKSTDGGTHWTAPHSRPALGSVTGVLYDASTRTILAYGAGIYRSTDGGSHWSSTLKAQSFTSMAAGSGKALYAASDAGLYVSSDDGAHWKTVLVIGSQPVIQVAAAGSVAYVVAPIALFKTTNDGKSWTTVATAPLGLEFIGVAPSDPNEVIGEISTQHGGRFYVTRDGGRSWRSANSGIHDTDFNASTIRVAPSSPNVAYTGAWGLHMYATHDGGRHWVETASLKK
jgi:photosystem II stability/assembly factor-like uncharacterized protein